MSIPRSAEPTEKKIEQKVEEKVEEKIALVDVKVRDPLNYNGFKCYAGIDTLTIDYNGRLWRGWCSHGGPIGSIYELPIKFPTEPIVCNLSRCNNGFDQQARKES